MTALAEDIRKKAMSLSASERAAIVHDLILSLDEPNSVKLHPDYETKIQKRIKSIENGTAKGIPAEEVYAKIEKKLSK